MILATLFVRYWVRDDISEGVTRVLYAMSKKGSRIKPHNCYTSVVASATTIGFGGSVGPEAPIVLTGSAIGSNIGQFMRLNYRDITLLLCCGAAGALSAVFKAPITGVVFVLEILMLDITVSSIIPLLISTVTATSLMFFLNGFEPVFSIEIKTFSLHNIRSTSSWARCAGSCRTTSHASIRLSAARLPASGLWGANGSWAAW